MRFTITLSSDEFGVEDFDYDSLGEMLEGFKRLCNAILEPQDDEPQDDIERTLSVKLRPRALLQTDPIVPILNYGTSQDDGQ